MSEHFDKTYFLNLLSSINNSQSSIKQVSSYMYYHRENYSEHSTELWKEVFLNTSQASSLLRLFYVVNEIIILSAKKAKLEYISSFGQILYEIILNLSLKCEEINCLLKVYEIIELWETLMIYSGNFLEEPQKLVREKLRGLGFSMKETGYAEKLRIVNSVDIKSDIEKRLERVKISGSWGNGCSEKRDTVKKESSNTMDTEEDKEGVEKELNGSQVMSMVTSPRIKHSGNPIVYTNDWAQYLCKFRDTKNQSKIDMTEKVALLQKVDKHDLTRKLFLANVDKESISANYSKLNKDKMLSFGKKILEQQEKNVFYNINDHDKEFIKDAKRNLEGLREFIIKDLVNRENLLFDLVNSVRSGFKQSSDNEEEIIGGQIEREQVGVTAQELNGVHSSARNSSNSNSDDPENRVNSDLAEKEDVEMSSNELIPNN